MVRIDKGAMDYYVKLTNLQSQYRAVGVNYNQVVKAINSGLPEKKALAALYKLERYTMEPVSFFILRSSCLRQNLQPCTHKE